MIMLTEIYIMNLCTYWMSLLIYLKMFISNHKHFLLCFKATVYIKHNKEVLCRNAKCTCRSDKKYKYCCGSLDKRKYNHLHINFLDIHKLNDEFCFE